MKDHKLAEENIKLQFSRTVEPTERGNIPPRNATTGAESLLVRFLMYKLFH